ncbi:MAG: alpha-amylase [Prevotella sp.]|nr:alpha-amylase [Prevotella sp.]
MKTIVYQALPRLWGNRNETRQPNGTMQQNGCGKMNDFSPSVLKQLREMGVTHVWYTGLLRHATKTDYSGIGIPCQHPAVVKGQAGSPYAVADYYDIDPDLAVKPEQRMEEFRKLVVRTHRAGLKMVIDFVPNHVARQYHSVCKPKGVKDLGEGDDVNIGFTTRNNFYYCPGQAFTPYFDLYAGEKQPYSEMPARATGNDHFDNAPGRNDWYETVKLNYGVDYYAGRVGHFLPIPDTWHKMLHILLFWAEQGVDAFRCDMAEMVPAEFWQWATVQVKEQHPGLQFIGEVYNPAEYRRYLAAGFDLLYDKVGMYDALRALTCGQADAQAVSAAWQQTGDIRHHMLYFLENHDEQRLASDFFAGDGRKGIPALAVSLLLGTNPFMLYMGQTLGEKGMDAEGFSGRDGRTTIFDYWSVDTLCRHAKGELTEQEEQLSQTYRRLMAIAQRQPAVGEGKMFDLCYVNRHQPRLFSFIRKSGKQTMLVVANFSDDSLEAHVVVPRAAFDYLEMTEGNHKATNLMAADRQATETLRLAADKPARLSVEPWNVRVMAF